MERVRVMWPRLPDADAVLPYLRRIDQVRVYSNFGPLSMELEQRYAQRFGVAPEQVAACASATVGLQGAIESQPDVSRVHCPTWTFPASPMAVRSAGAALTLHDVSESDWLIDAPAPAPGEAIMPVLPFGAEWGLERWLGWQHVVLDAAASGGAAHRDLSALPAGWSVVVSLHATKVLGAGEGGIAVFGDVESADRFRAFTNLGFERTRTSERHGVNGKLPEATAAYALAALDGWELEEQQWRAARALARAAESQLGLTSPTAAYPGVSPYWVVRFPDGPTRDAAERSLHEAGVDTRRWWENRCDLMPAFAGAAQAPTRGFPGADALVATVLGLPFHRDLSAADVERVVQVLEPVVAAA